MFGSLDYCGKRMVGLALATVIFTSQSACVIWPTEVWPRQRGYVLDASTGEPIQGAEVLVNSWRIYMPQGFDWEPVGDGDVVIAKFTNVDGYWKVRSKRVMTLQVLAPDGIVGFTETVSISCDGYESVLISPFSPHKIEGAGYSFRLGEVTMKRNRRYKSITVLMTPTDRTSPSITDVDLLGSRRLQIPESDTD